MEHDSEDEGIADYKIGGYHPIHIGEVINDRYVII
jgi:serine/threonine-protein kinase SRPK3